MTAQSGYSQEDLKKRQMQAQALLQGATSPQAVSSPMQGFAQMAQAGIAGYNARQADAAMQNANVSPSQFPTAPASGMFGLGALLNRGGGNKGLF